MNASHAKIDYCRFTFPIALLGNQDESWTLNHILMAFHDHTQHLLLGVVTAGRWVWRETAGFYDKKIECPKTKLSIEWKAGNPHALVNITGTSCDLLLQTITAADLAKATNGRCTRMDFAVDFPTEIKPSEFTEIRGSNKTSTFSTVNSPTGETCYIGSRSSERMARVYRYYPPHPRSHLLRVEAEYKGDAAKEACKALMDREEQEVIYSAHLPFKWMHPIWLERVPVTEKIPARAYDKEGAETLKWLVDVVAPSLRKAHERGLINLVDWVKEYLKI